MLVRHKSIPCLFVFATSDLTVYIFVYYCFLSPKILIEEKALDTIAHLCDGDARAGLNGLQLAVQAQVSSSRLGQSGPDAAREILVKEEHVKEGLQRSHILYDRAGNPTRTYFIHSFHFHCYLQEGHLLHKTHLIKFPVSLQMYIYIHDS